MALLVDWRTKQDIGTEASFSRGVLETRLFGIPPPKPTIEGNPREWMLEAIGFRGVRE